MGEVAAFAGVGIFAILLRLFFVALAILPLILNCYLASKKKRNVVGWFFLGLFFSYLSTIIIAFLPAKEQ